MKILVLGEQPYFLGLHYPQQTDWIWSSHFKASAKKVSGIPVFSPGVAWRLYHDLRAKKYDLIVLPPLKFYLWRPTRSALHNLFNLLKQMVFKFRYFGVYWVLFAKHPETPAIVIDLLDTMIIAPQNFMMFPHLKAYFKRELPQNNWHAFLYTSARNEDVSSIRRQKKFHDILAKVHPFPLKVIPAPVDVDESPERKEFDVFYAGENPKSTVRMRGCESLKKLAIKGYRIDIAEGHIDYEEFCMRCRRAWLVWSPEGSGWDCGRHYESLLLGAVPVINYPTIDRYKPFIDSRHCFYYGAEEDDLHRVIEKALGDKDALLRMIRQGREHLNAHYTPDKIFQYIMNEINRSGPDPDRIF